MHLLPLDKSETMAEKEEEEKTAVVTGSRGGIGFETSLLLAKNGFRTYATVRDLESQGNKGNFRQT
jgi:NAD(P)-dependent dehydrogenase (short-subunit alcohol dehydrogenase family)